MRGKRWIAPEILLLLCPLLFAACALGDTVDPTPAPPLTLAPAPTLVFAGDCAVTTELDGWLQSTWFLAQDFQKELNSAAALQQSQLFDSVTRMAQLRDATNATTTPACAVETQLRLVDAMTTAVNTFQAYANGDLPDLGNTVAEVNSQLDEVIAMQNDLMQQLEAQYQQQRPTAEPES
jgi:uncharacterized phage infection (PIP) family protein YhgE